MFNLNMFNRTKLAVVAIIAVVALIALSSAAMANNNCKKVNGKFTLEVVTENCPSLVGLCASGSYSGDIKGSSSFIGLAYVDPETDPANVQFVIGENIIHTSGGDIMTKDFISFNTIGAGDFGEVDAVVGGTGDWEDATGYIRAIGTLPAGEIGQGDYTGEICTE